jgi:hypothetical protein
MRDYNGLMRDYNGLALAYVYFEEEPERRTAARLRRFKRNTMSATPLRS